MYTTLKMTYSWFNISAVSLGGACKHLCNYSIKLLYFSNLHNFSLLLWFHWSSFAQFNYFKSCQMPSALCFGGNKTNLEKGVWAHLSWEVREFERMKGKPWFSVTCQILHRYDAKGAKGSRLFCRPLQPCVGVRGITLGLRSGARYTPSSYWLAGAGEVAESIINFEWAD